MVSKVLTKRQSSKYPLFSSVIRIITAIVSKWVFLKENIYGLFNMHICCMHNFQTKQQKLELYFKMSYLLLNINFNLFFFIIVAITNIHM